MIFTCIISEKKTTEPGSIGYIPKIFPGKESTPLKPRNTNSARRAGLVTPETPKSTKRQATTPLASVTPKTHRTQPLVSTTPQTPRIPPLASTTPKTPRTQPNSATTLPTETPKRPRGRPSTHPDFEFVSPSTPLTNAVWQTTDHDYPVFRQAPPSPTDDIVRPLHERIQELEARLAASETKNLSLETIQKSDKMCQFYTNLPNYDVFKGVCEHLEEKVNGQLNYWKGAATQRYWHFRQTMDQKPGPSRKLSFEQEFFLTLVKMKQGFQNEHLAQLFGVSDTLVSRVFSTWVTFLSSELRELFEMKDSDDDVAECFKDFPDLKIVVDCTEQQVERSSDLQGRKEFWSNYKQRDTIKWMIGLSKNLTVNYISCGYGGRASDKLICTESETMKENLPPGSSVMADRGFLVTDELKRLGVTCIMPVFKGRGRSQMTAEELAKSEWIAKARIHIERIIQRVRTFHILDAVARLSMKDIYDQIFTSAAYLCNFQMPIIKATRKVEFVDN